MRRSEGSNDATATVIIMFLFLSGPSNIAIALSLSEVLPGSEFFARSRDTENQLEQIGHQDASLRRPLAPSTPNRIFGTQRSD